MNATFDEWSRSSALETLKDVAVGTPRETIVTAALKAGLDVFTRTDISLGDSCARAYAMDRVGATGLPEAIEFLKSMTPERVGPDDSQAIHPAAQVALYKALFRQEADPDRQVAFLEQQLVKPSVGQVASWAITELCDRGSRSSLLKITRIVKSRNGDDPYSDEQIRECEQHMEIVNRGPTRLEALTTALTVDQSLQDKEFRLTHWIVSQLRDLHTAEADTVILRFAAEIERRYPDVPAVTSVRQNAELLGLAQGIRIMMSPSTPK